MLKNIFVFLSIFITSSLVANERGIQISSTKFSDDSTSIKDVFHFEPTRARAPYQGYSELIQYLLPSPDQEDAGSCLYMATTGIVEWWYAKLHNISPMVLNGDMDFSERYLMNISSDETYIQSVLNWRTDTVLALNTDFLFATNKSYPYRKGFYTELEDDLIIGGSEYGTQYNWIDERETITSTLVEIPKFDRKIMHQDPNNDQWAVASAPNDIASQVKAALEKNRAPVLVIYNHFGYWHAVIVAGFNENQTHECRFVEQSISYQFAKAEKNIQKAASMNDGPEKEKLLKSANYYKTLAEKIQKPYLAAGGCSKKGIFYVRDSIYGDESQTPYDYDPSIPGFEGTYSKTIIEHEEEWLTYLSNHVIQIFAM